MAAGDGRFILLGSVIIFRIASRTGEEREMFIVWLGGSIDFGNLYIIGGATATSDIAGELVQSCCVPASRLARPNIVW